MKQETVQLIDPLGNLIAVAKVVDQGAYYGGTIDLGATPAAVRGLFEEFDEYVNGQMFSLLDEIEDRIAALGIRGTFDDGRQLRLNDVQVCPSTGDVAFKVATGATSEASRQQETRTAAPERQPSAERG